MALGGYSTLKTFFISQLVGIAVVGEGTVEEVIDGRGFVIRHETVLRSPVSGTVTLAAADGVRARTDTVVAELSDTVEKSRAEERVAQLEADLAAFNASHAAAEETLNQTALQAQAETQAKTDQLRTACLEADLAAMERLTAELDALVLSLAETRGELDTIREDRASLEASLATARAALAQSVFRVTAPHAGTVSYRLDGLEEILTPAAAASFTTKELLTVSHRGAVVVDQSRLQAGDPVAKIVGDDEVYVAVIVTNGEADLLSSQPDVSLRFEGFDGRRETVAALYRVGERENNGYCLVTYLAAELLDGMVSQRQVDTTIIVHRYTGTVIPRKALVHRGGLDGVFVVQGVVCRFQPVTVLGGNREDCVVEGVAPQTQVITTPWLVDEGTRIGLREGARGLA